MIFVVICMFIMGFGFLSVRFVIGDLVSKWIWKIMFCFILVSLFVEFNDWELVY